jgi:predicted RNA-binding protein YlqC (UPF0109 family)
MSSIDQQFVEFVVKSLVSKPDEVKIERRIDEKGVLLELTVDPEDLGRVIGKRGATAQSLRTLLRALGTKNDARYNLKIIDNGIGGNYGDSSHEDSHEEMPAAAAAPAAAVDDSMATAGDDTLAADEDVPLDDDATSATKAPEPSDRLTQTRRELEEFDDLDV